MADETFTKADLDKAVKDAVDAAVETAKAGLETKNKELLAELKEAKKGRTIDPAEVERLEAKIDDLQGKLTVAEKSATAATKLAEKAAKDLETEQGFTQKLLIQDGLKSALIANGVKDEDFIDSLAAKFAPTASITVDGEKREAKIGDKALADHIKEWAATDAGKKFVAAAVNSGGGAGGGGGKGAGKVLSEADVNAMKPKDRSTFFAEGGTIAQPA